MRWADLGDHHQGIKWIKCFNPPQQERKGKKKSWLTDRKSSPNTKLWSAWRLAEVASSYPEPGSACLESSGESEVDFAISCWRARTPHYIIHMLHNTLAVRHRPTHTHSYQTHTHADTHARGEAGSTTDVPFANVSAPPVSQPPPADVYVLYSRHNVFAYDCAFCVHCVFVCIVFCANIAGLKKGMMHCLYLCSCVFVMCYPHAHTLTYAHI